ncbi:MAG: 16S rRNA (uracil(1498)-N(3))-methyltransferase [Synechococcaceae cyanobacterium]|nr:16S rRNA (uracil(1498)-N(3))-methyltransferase [Synechococcaceae cyanobacterium]
MSRELRRLWIEPSRLAAEIALQPQESHYLSRVLRCRDGDRLEVFDGRGRLWTAALRGQRQIRLEQPLAEPLVLLAPAWPELGLGMSVPRRDADLAWRMATELGADRLVPLRSDRGVAPDRLPLERWRTIVQEACEQCERLWLPQLQPPQDVSALLAASPATLSLLAVTRRPGVLSVGAALRAWGQRAAGEGEALEAGASVLIAVGPEGGWSPREEEIAGSCGWIPVSLAPTILRTATAAVAAMVQLTAWRSFSCGSCSPPST